MLCANLFKTQTDCQKERTTEHWRMKLLLTVSLGLLALSLPALCWPQMDENLPFDPSEQQDREGEMEQEDYDFANSQGELNTLDFIMKNMGTGK